MAYIESTSKLHALFVEDGVPNVSSPFLFNEYFILISLHPERVREDYLIVNLTLVGGNVALYYPSYGELGEIELCTRYLKMTL